MDEDEAMRREVEARVFADRVVRSRPLLGAVATVMTFAAEMALFLGLAGFFSAVVGSGPRSSCVLAFAAHFLVRMTVIDSLGGMAARHLGDIGSMMGD